MHQGEREAVPEEFEDGRVDMGIRVHWILEFCGWEGSEEEKREPQERFPLFEKRSL